MKINIAGDAFVVTSSLSVEDIKFVAKNSPKALRRFEGEGENLKEVFAIAYGEGRGVITPFGIVFGGKTRDEKQLATFTGTIPTSAENSKEYVADVVAPTVAYLEALEKDITKKVKELRDARAKLMDKITDIAQTAQ